jgi:hypothetical protein
VDAPISGAEGIVYTVHCVDHSHELTEKLASRTYESETIEDIIIDLFLNIHIFFNVLIIK